MFIFIYLWYIETADQKAAYNQLLKKRSETLKKTTNDNAKKWV